MATIKRRYVFFTCILSGLAALFSIVSLATEQWIVTDNAQWLQQGFSSSNTIQYGLFQGFYRLQEPTYVTAQITMTCLMKENVCALLCGIDDDDRYTLLRQLYNNGPNVTHDESNCPSVKRAFSYQGRSLSTFDTDTTTDKKFINAGVWISTIIFLVISIALGAGASALALWNTVSNPIQDYFSIFGLYIYNAAALCSTVIAMSLWGIMHPIVTFHDVGIYYTLTGQMTSDKTAHLGYSYWILFLPLFLYAASIGVLYIREYLLSKDPGHKMVQREENADPGIYLY